MRHDVALLFTAVLSLVVAWDVRTLYAPGYPSNPASYLQLISQHLQLASFTWCLWIVIDFLSIVPIIAICVFLQRYNRALAWRGGLMVMFYAIYDVSTTMLNSLTLANLAHGYASVVSDAMKAPFVVAATYGYYALPIQTALTFAISSIGYLLWCVPMAKSFFGRWLAISGAIVNIVELIGSASPVDPASHFLSLCMFLSALLLALWGIIVGVQLYRYGLRIGTNVDITAGMT